MKILVTGASGLVGSALVSALTTSGHIVTRLARPQSSAGAAGPQVTWDPSAGTIDSTPLEGVEAAVHLAGENIAAGRWTAKQKARILESRVKGTQLLAQSLVRLNHPPHTLVCASAIGYYGDRGDEWVREGSPAGKGFLPDVCRQWEAASAAAAEKGVRVVALRFGLVLSPGGGALAKMLPAFRLGVAGRLGDGTQYMSWIALDDVIGATRHCLATHSLKGPVNVATPNPVTNLVFTKTLGRVLSRPTVFPMPAAAARLAFGEMADSLLLSSTRVEPERLTSTGYRFLYPELEGALRHVLGREK